MKRTLCSALIAGLCAGLAHAGTDTPAPVAPVATAATAAPATVAADRAGVDRNSIDAQVRPQDDFFRYS